MVRPGPPPAIASLTPPAATRHKRAPGNDRHCPLACSRAHQTADEIPGRRLARRRDVVLVVCVELKLPRVPRWALEPWSGHLGEAPILFLSSSPWAAAPGASTGPHDVTAESTVDPIVGLCDGALDEGGLRIEDGIRWLYAQASAGPTSDSGLRRRPGHVRSWAGTRCLAGLRDHRSASRVIDTILKHRSLTQ